MKFCISFGKLELKYLLYLILLFILEIYIYYCFDYNKLYIIDEHLLFHSFCFFLGYLLNIILAWISYIKSKENEKFLANPFKEITNESIEHKDDHPYQKHLLIANIFIFFFICLILLFADILENIESIIEENFYNEKNYDDEFIFIQFLSIFLTHKLGKEVYYKHQNISFSILLLVEIIKNFYFYIKKLYKITTIISIILNIINSNLYAIYYFYVKGLMKYKFILPAKCNCMIGIINVPLIILTYFIISFTPLGNINNDYYYDNIFELFKDLGNIDIKNAILLILLPFVYGIFQFIVIKIINYFFL